MPGGRLRRLERVTTAGAEAWLPQVLASRPAGDRGSWGSLGARSRARTRRPEANAPWGRFSSGALGAAAGRPGPSRPEDSSSENNRRGSVFFSQGLDPTHR